MKTTKKTKVTKTGKKAAPAAPAMETSKERAFQEVAIGDIRVNPLNPRKNFSGQKYDELLASIRTKGVIVPILLRPLPDGTFEIIAGERRFRAACEAAKGNGGIEKTRIPAIVQKMSDDDAYDCMTIENLQRADLTPLEEARAFKLYLDRKGPEALQDLAERVGINPCYIRRRTAVLKLSETILKSWEDGDLSYGHLEQLVRISDRKERMEQYENVLRQGLTVKYLRERIESRTPKLACALFSKDTARCTVCPRNTDVQRELFGEDFATKALCLDPKCYEKHQAEWIQANWPKFKSSRNLKTSGFRLMDHVRWDDHHSIYDEEKEKCKTCEHFLSIITIDGKVHSKIDCFGPKSCHDALFHPHSAAAKKAADPNAPRVSWHGEFFREEFYKTRIPELANTLPHDDEKILRILLLTILESHTEAAEAFGRKYDKEHLVKNKYSADTSYNLFEHGWNAIEKLDVPLLRQYLQETALRILMDPRTTIAATRRLVAVHLGSDLAKEWRLTKEYLDKKTTKEIHAIAEKFGLFKDDKARAYLYETLGKKRDRFDLCKKAELVKIILESGVDLAGVVHD